MSEEFKKEEMNGEAAEETKAAEHTEEVKTETTAEQSAAETEAVQETAEAPKAEEKKANTAGKASFGAQRNIPAKRSNLPYHTAISART